MGFKFKVTETKFTLLDERQWYVARLIDVTPEEMEWKGVPSPKFKFKFVVLDPPDFQGREVNGMVNQPSGNELNERHHLYQWVTALGGGIPPSVGDDIDFPDCFFDKIVMIRMKSTKKIYDGKEMTFQNVDRIAVCPNAQDYVDVCPDKMAMSTVRPERTPPQPNVPEPQGTPTPQPQETPATPDPLPPTAADAGSTSVVIDGVVEDIPF